MSRPHLAAASALCALALACHPLPEERVPVTHGEPGPPPGPPHTAEPSAVPPPAEVDEAALPPAISEVTEPGARVFACLEYGHVDRLEGLDELDRDAIITRIETFKAARRVCQPLVHQQFGGFPALVTAFDAEWQFLLTCLALTAEAKAAHNAEIACANLRLAVRASRQAVDATRAYHAWLDQEVTASGRDDPFLSAMVRRAEVKVTVFTRMSTELTNQYRSECQSP